jgi:hypothetical protein
MRAKFRIGWVVVTPAALGAIEDSGQDAEYFLDRHAAGDWGEVHPLCMPLNANALETGGRILSQYRTLKGRTIWLLTELQRHPTTTVLLSHEYPHGE